MEINSLNAINRSIKKNITLSLLSLLALSLLILNVIYYSNVTAVNQQNKIEISSNFDLLKSNISEKISIIASSSAFVDYLRSGSVSQKSLKSDFIYDLKTLKLKDINGMKIVSASGDTIFSDGASSSYYVDLPLCYFDRGLDSTLGDCSHHLILYFDITALIKSLQKVNDNLIQCKHCTPIDFLSSKTFGSFNVANASKMPLFFDIKKPQSFNIITINLIVFLFMAILASWTWRRTNFILDKYISHPLKKIANKLKNGEGLAQNGEIDELAYLVNQIQDREEKLKIAKENENLVVIGQMLSQVAHDMRSPLAVINTIVKQAVQIPKRQRTLMRGADQQLRGLTDNLLSQYRVKPVTNLLTENTAHEPQKISILLSSIISEKQAEYNQLPVAIHYKSDSNSDNATTDISMVDFKRVISNILNNAIEAIHETGNVTVTLTASSNSAIIRINDSGVGMKPELIEKILNGKSVSYKKNGVGIGLASSYNFIQSWGGDLDIASQQNVGTTVIITIPTSIHHDIALQDDPCHEYADLILIDDNKSVTDAWELSAISKRRKIITFNNLNDVGRGIKKFDRTIPIYIDSDLGGAIRGEQYAKVLYEQGFFNIYLTTGYKNSSFEPMSWIKGIIGKEPNIG